MFPRNVKVSRDFLLYDTCLNTYYARELQLTKVAYFCDRDFSYMTLFTL